MDMHEIALGLSGWAKTSSPYYPTRDRVGVRLRRPRVPPWPPPDRQPIAVDADRAEIVLGVDNIIFLSILTKLPSSSAVATTRSRRRDAHAHRAPAALLGDGDGAASAWSARRHGRSVILLGGGLFRIAKATWDPRQARRQETIGSSDAACRRDDRAGDAARHRVLARLGDHRGRHGAAIEIMIAAVVVSVGAMLLFARVGVYRAHPTTRCSRCRS
jgi:hypothetical protein